MKEFALQTTDGTDIEVSYNETTGDVTAKILRRGALTELSGNLGDARDFLRFVGELLTGNAQILDQEVMFPVSFMNGLTISLGRIVLESEIFFAMLIGSAFHSDGLDWQTLKPRTPNTRTRSLTAQQVIETLERIAGFATP